LENRRTPTGSIQFDFQSNFDSVADAQIDAPSITILIVNWNSAAYLRDCLRSVRDTIGAIPAELVLVDASSTDESVAVARDLWPSMNLITVPESLGYVKANNVGLQKARGKYTMYLNSDTIIQPGTFEVLVEFLNAHPEVAAASGAILNPDGSDQGVVRQFPSIMNGIFGRRSVLSRLFPNNRWYRRYMQSRRTDGLEPFDTEMISAASMVVRTDLVRQIGGFDERFRFYWVDGELCTRLIQRGYRVCCVPRARVIHYEGQGGSTSTFKKRLQMNAAFNHGAYLAYVSYHRLGPLDPRRLAVKVILTARMVALAIVQFLRPSKATSSGGVN
jgi:N-acetylglucosaminyl-diphospho-decaprenol L-rhamnosyltransferase